MSESERVKLKSIVGQTMHKPGAVNEPQCSTQFYKLKKRYRFVQ